MNFSLHKRASDQENFVGIWNPRLPADNPAYRTKKIGSRVGKQIQRFKEDRELGEKVRKGVLDETMKMAEGHGGARRAHSWKSSRREEFAVVRRIVSSEYLCILLIDLAL